MKLSVSLTENDVRFLDEYAERLGIGSRSAVIQRAVRLLQASEFGPAYEAAWEEWAAGDKAAWEATAADGMRLARR